MSENTRRNSAASRRLDRARAFQVLYGLFFNPPANARALAGIFQRALYAEPVVGSEMSTELIEEPEAAPGQPAKKTPLVPDIHALPPDEDAHEKVFTPEVSGKEQPEGFAWELVLGVWSRQAELDRLITGFSKNWRLERMGRVELALLRLAVFELLFRDDVPPKVVLNEAIELSRRFGDENSHGFVNGILDAAVRAVENGELKRGGLFWGEAEQ